MLKFIGCGSAFNTDLGNNSAYIKFEDGLLLIDCGSSIFERIKKLNLLEGIKEISILITHLHADHIGSLGDLVFYSYFVKGIKPSILYPDKKMQDLLLYMGVWDNIYNLIHPDEYNKIRIQTRQTVHIPDKPHFRAYSYLISEGNKCFFYSGDSSKLDNEIINKLEAGEIYAIYQDTNGKDIVDNENSTNIAHLRLCQLEKLIPKNFRNKVWCMHLDESFDKSRASKLGFNVVKSEFEI